MSEDEQHIDPAEMFAVMQSTRRSTQSKLTRGYASMLFVWAGAWLFGFGALWFGTGIGGVDLLPAVAAWIIFGVLIAAAIAWSIIVGIRSASSGIHGRSQLQGTLYGYSWTISMVAAWLIIVGLQKAGLSQELANVLYPALFVLLVGVLYLAGGALWRSPAQYILGIVMIIVAIVATFVGTPWHYLIYATVGPVAMIIVGFMMIRGIIPAEPRTPGDES